MLLMLFFLLWLLLLMLFSAGGEQFLTAMEGELSSIPQAAKEELGRLMMKSIKLSEACGDQSMQKERYTQGKQKYTDASGSGQKGRQGKWHLAAAMANAGTLASSNGYTADLAWASPLAKRRNCRL